jgi:uncharacterized protein
MQVLALLKKRKAATEQAKKEAEAAQRSDLAEKQDKEMSVIADLMGSVKMLEGEELRDIVKQGIEALKSLQQEKGLNLGGVMKELQKSGGALDGKLYDAKTLVEVVKEEMPKD